MQDLPIGILFAGDMADVLDVDEDQILLMVFDESAPRWISVNDVRLEFYAFEDGGQ